MAGRLEECGMPDDAKTWRYMSLGRFVWLVQNKELYFARADLAGDPWELSLTNEQMKAAKSWFPPDPEAPLLGPLFNLAHVMAEWRRRIFINCWTVQPQESHALWKIYCHASAEGVAIQTTVGRLLKSTDGYALALPVTYREPYERDPSKIHIADIATEKRSMFAYEKELRLIHDGDRDQPEKVSLKTVGRAIPWDPEQHIECVYVHPQADRGFDAVVRGIIASYAPALGDCVKWSAMRERPGSDILRHLPRKRPSFDVPDMLPRTEHNEEEQA